MAVLTMTSSWFSFSRSMGQRVEAIQMESEEPSPTATLPEHAAWPSALPTSAALQGQPTLKPQ